MMNYTVRALFYLLLISTFAACGDTSSVQNGSSDTHPGHSGDVHTYANLDEIRTTHLHLDLNVNFDNTTIYGVARHTMENSGADTAVFDIKNLDIQKVTIGKEDEKETDYVIGEYDSILGAPLQVAIAPDVQYINIYYKTTDKAEALDWLSPELTAGKKHPYLYSQGQAILTRTWIPVQDSPSNRITYSASVKVPKELLPIMSAENPKEKNETGEYFFEMKQPIPAYLIAIAVGDIEYRSLGKNCGVYSEPELIDACAYEFVDLPKMIHAAENLYGKYRWGQYDVVVLPYSFPFGGMENPRLTFANPTLIAGDRSLVSVIAHELAHSWSGNLVTNATWNDFWLNEGFTVYFENRIMEELYGKEVADILAIVEYQELQNTLKRESPDDTKLKLDLENRNPDDGMTDIAYIKGASFLRTLEHTVGRTKLDAFLKNYFDQHAFETITTEDFIAYLESDLLAPNNIAFNVDQWIYEPGLPPNCVIPTSERLDNIKELADKFARGEDIFKRKKLKREQFTTQEWQVFIRQFPEKVDPARMALIDEHLHFRDCGNSEIMAEWYVLGIHSGYKAIRPDMEKFLAKVGRRKYLEPIYETLADSNDADDRKWATEVFNRVKNNYHAVSRNTIQDILN